MKRVKIFKWLISTSICVLSFAWALKLNQYFFETTQADQFGLLIITLVGLVFFQGVKSSLKSNDKVWLLFFLIPAPFLLYPALLEMIAVSDLAWLIIFLFMLLMTVGVVFLFESKWKVLVVTALGIVFFIPFEFKKEQLQFYDKVVAYIETRSGEAQIVEWKKDYWVYYNKQLQFSTIDRHMYQEAYVQPVMQLVDIKRASNVLILGGDNGMIIDELSKFEIAGEITYIPLDNQYADFLQKSEYISFSKPENIERIRQVDFFSYLAGNVDKFDLIFLDLPDPVDVHYGQFYEESFYSLVNQSLKESGLVVTQSGDVYKNNSESNRIANSLENTGLNILRYHCQIPTIGQWSWVLASKKRKEIQMLSNLKNASEITPTKWWNQNAMRMMLTFGKSSYFQKAGTLKY